MRPKIWMFVNVDWFFVSHRLPIAQGAENRKFRMTVFADTSGRCPKFETVGFEFKKSPMRRKARVALIVWELLKVAIVIYKGRPEVLHAVTAKPIVVVGVLARLFGIPFVASVSGLGPAFSSKGTVLEIRRSLVVSVYRFIFRNQNSAAIVQTAHDRDSLLSARICQEEQLHIFRGSGVQVAEYARSTDTESASSDTAQQKLVKVLMASRMLADKGVIEYLRSVELISKERDGVVWQLAGPVDVDSPTALSMENVLKQCDRAGVQFLGNVENMPELLKSVSLLVYPSYYPEGLPKILAEAAAAGIPVVTTDHPGCRDAIVDGCSGLLTTPRDTEDLARAISYLLDEPKTRMEMGRFATVYARQNYDVVKIVDQHFLLYRSMLS